MLVQRLAAGGRRHFASTTAAAATAASTAPAAAQLSPEIRALLESFRTNPSDATATLLQQPTTDLPVPVALEHVVAQLFRGKHTKEALDVLQLSLDRSIGIDYSIAIRKSGALDRQDSNAVLSWLHANAASIETDQHVSMIRVCLRLKHFSSAVRLFELIRTRQFNGRVLSKDVMYLLAAVESVPNGRLRHELQTKLLRFHSHPSNISAPELVTDMCQRQPDAASQCVQWAIGVIYWRSPEDWPGRLALIEAILASALAHGVALENPMRFSMAFAKCRDHDLDPERLVHLFLAMAGQNLVDPNESSCMAAIHACQNANNFALALTLFHLLKRSQPMNSRLFNTGLYSAAKSGNEAAVASLALEMVAANVTPDKRSLAVVQSLAASPTSMGFLIKDPQLVDYFGISSTSMASANGSSPRKQRQSVPPQSQPSEAKATPNTSRAPTPKPSGDSSCAIM
ncbi:hypothetical protein DYB31_004004 [Aphanomyces astaci]|uniref:Pentacotripeptide-repeat region of PRORP domain-containing protein n=1 Tax=Aphanomyces astaci TaxID=112090 RepID=A0A397EJG1_APHAT|nr:hypothetical protein DYB31_004004 [Aphanomyces astaci]